MFPTWLAFNRFTAGFIRRMLKREGISLTRKQILLLIKEIKPYRKSHAGWNLVEANDKNGGTVTVKI